MSPEPSVPEGGRFRGRVLKALAAVVLLGIAAPAPALPPAGSPAPPIALDDLHGTRVETASLRGRTLVLVFGELDHEKTPTACADVIAALADPRVPADAAVPILIVTRRIEPPPEAAALPELILHDPRRDAFGAYRILVVPSVVVVGPDGAVVHAMPGFLPRLREILTEAVLLTAGKITPEHFERTLAADKPGPPATTDPRAARLVQLARQLARRGLPEMAEQRFNEALGLAPDNAEARLGLARLLAAGDRLDEAEQHFRSVLAAEPDSVEARLGLASIGVRRGGDAAAGAEAELRRLREAHPSHPRVHYLIGLVHDGRAEHQQAAAAFRRSAELLLAAGEDR